MTIKIRQILTDWASQLWVRHKTNLEVGQKAQQHFSNFVSTSHRSG
ncbi:MAG: hypothetical protein SOY62_07570 [Streptococcus orisratti]|nr:hypothetical protein [Streptococcus orisratti]